MQQLDDIMKIWLNTNISAHSFIERSYWDKSSGMVRSLLPSSDLFVYEDEYIIKGFIGITGECYIAGLFVDAKYQSHGIGRALLEFCKKRYTHLELDVFIMNKNAVQFYEKNGFLVSERKMNSDFKCDEYHMVWPE